MRVHVVRHQSHELALSYACIPECMHQHVVAQVAGAGGVERAEGGVQFLWRPSASQAANVFKSRLSPRVDEALTPSMVAILYPRRDHFVLCCRYRIYSLTR